VIAFTVVCCCASCECAFPDTLKEVSAPGGYIERHDWKFYVQLLAKLPKGLRPPMFGDYATVNPGFVAKMDIRKINPAGKIVYATKDKWLVRKGGAFRGNEKQMHKLSDEVVKSGLFRGPAFSAGDDYIDKCASGRAIRRGGRASASITTSCR
jgi:Beta protein